MPYIFYKDGPLYIYHISRPQSLEVSWISESPPSTQMHVNSCHALWYFFFYILSHAFSVCNYAQLTTLNHNEFFKILPLLACPLWDLLPQFLMVQKQRLQTATCWIRSPSTKPVSIFHLSASKAALRAGRKIEILIWKRPPSPGLRLRNGFSARSGRATPRSDLLLLLLHLRRPKGCCWPRELPASLSANQNRPGFPQPAEADAAPTLGQALGSGVRLCRWLGAKTAGGGDLADGRWWWWWEACRLLRGDGRHGQRPAGAEALP